MRLVVAGAVLLFATAGCSVELPLLGPSLSPAQILALPAKAGIRDACFAGAYTGADGTVFTRTGGTVQLRPARALSAVSSATAGKGGAPAEFRVVGGIRYDLVTSGWSHPRWVASPEGAGLGPPEYFDLWWRLPYAFQLEGQEGSAVDRAWRLVAHPAALGPGATLRLWIRQRDGYPLQYREDFGKGTSTTVFDRFNAMATISAPPPQDLLPPGAGVPDVASYPFKGGSLRILSVDYDYQGPLAAAGPGSGRVVGVECYLDSPSAQPLLADLPSWQLIGADGAAYPSLAPANAAADGDLLAFFAVPTGSQRPFSLHVILSDFAKSPAPSDVVLDAQIKLS